MTLGERMSFENLKKTDLVKVAEAFGTRSTGTKAEIVEDLAAEGVTWELYQTLTSEESEAVEPVVPAAPNEPVDNGSGPDVVIKFLGGGSIRTRGVKVSSENPFVVVKESVADALIEKNPYSWRLSTAKELEAFYA
jgi:hypothetical protein